jgi:hypothetical protein
MYDVLTPQNPETLLLSRISKAKLSVLNPLLRGRFTSILHKLRNDDVDCVFMSVFIHGIPKTDGQIHHLLLSQEGDTGLFRVVLCLALPKQILIVGLTVDQTQTSEDTENKKE